MNELNDWIAKNWNIDHDIQMKVLYSILAVVLLWLVQFLILRIVFRKIEDVKYRYYWKNGVRNAYYIILIITIGAIWIDRFGSLATFLGLVTAGLAIALQDAIVNLAGWFFIIIRKPFEVGDRIQIGEFSGDVIDIRFFQFTINEISNWVDADQSTGRVIHIPNGKVFKEPQANYNQGFSHIWNEIGVLITFESNWEKAKQILEEIIKEHAEHLSKAAKKKLIEASKKFMIFYTALTPIVYLTVKDSGVMLTMRYLCNPKRRRASENKIWQNILKAFDECDDIDFAYPTHRVYYNPKEGKEGARKSDQEGLHSDFSN